MVWWRSFGGYALLNNYAVEPAVNSGGIRHRHRLFLHHFLAFRPINDETTVSVHSWLPSCLHLFAGKTTAILLFYHLLFH